MILTATTRGPQYHAGNQDPPQVGHDLTRSQVKMGEELANKQRNGKPQTGFQILLKNRNLIRETRRTPLVEGKNPQSDRLRDLVDTAYIL